MNRIARAIPPDDLLYIRFSKEERQSILRLYQRGDLKSRRLACQYVDAGVGVRQNRRFIFDMFDRMIPDRSTYVRWQSLLNLAGYIETHLEQVWPLVLKWGSVRNRDIRTAVACCVLEHIFQFHFDSYFPLAAEHVARGNRHFAYTIAYCWKLGQAEFSENTAKFDSFVREHFPKGLSRR